MKKFHFMHDYSARNDGKMLKVRAKFGNAEGYGMFWMVVEVMAESGDGYISCSAYDELALSFGIPVEKIEPFIDYCVEIGLFSKEKGRITSKRILEHIEWRNERSASGKKGAAARERNKIKKAQPHAENDTQDDTKAHQIKENKGKEESKKNEVPTDLDVGSKIKEPTDNSVPLGADAPRDATHHEEAQKFFADDETRQQCVDDIVAQSAGARTRDYVAEQVQLFTDYWLEQNKAGKPRWRLEKTFQVKRRLVTWFHFADQKAGRPNSGGTMFPKHAVISV